MLAPLASVGRTSLPVFSSSLSLGLLSCWSVVPPSLFFLFLASLGLAPLRQVTAGVPTTFIQQLVHLSPVHRRAGVLGEVHKSYVMVPDVDRLLNELTMHGGVVPGEEQDEGDGLMVMGGEAMVAGVKREGGANKRE
jgi:hypothetical protein